MRSDPPPIGLEPGNESFHTLVCDLHHQYSGYVTKGLTPSECPEVRNSRIRILNRLRKNPNIGRAAPKGAIDFEGLAVSLKRYPDTKPVLFRSLFRCSSAAC
jgi:hypothetical protein